MLVLFGRPKAARNVKLQLWNHRYLYVVCSSSQILSFFCRCHDRCRRCCCCCCCGCVRMMCSGHRPHIVRNVTGVMWMIWRLLLLRRLFLMVMVVVMMLLVLQLLLSHWWVRICVHNIWFKRCWLMVGRIILVKKQMIQRLFSIDIDIRQRLEAEAMDIGSLAIRLICTEISCYLGSAIKCEFKWCEWEYFVHQWESVYLHYSGLYQIDRLLSELTISVWVWIVKYRCDVHIRYTHIAHMNWKK